MPPQQTNLTSETGRDAAGLGPDLATELVNATEDDLAVARPFASIATLDDALAEKDAAGPLAASIRSASSLLKQYWRALQQRRQRRSLRTGLCDLSERERMDIGLTRGEVDYIAAQRAIDSLKDNLRIWSRGVM